MQTMALLLDAYRELNARKLFWIVLAISLLVVLIVGALGVNEEGFTILWFPIDSTVMNSTQFPPRLFYLSAFLLFAVPIWLTWAATILALTSTASVIPDFISQGSIELTLSKPISRVRLYLTKCAGALLFALLQVLVFSVAAFFVIGIRGGSWEFGIFWAVPIVTVFFSYLYSVCALIGLLTRSTLAALLLTLLFWFIVFIVSAADSTLLTFKLDSQSSVRSAEAEVAELEAEIEQFDNGEMWETPEEGGLLNALRGALENPDDEEARAAKRAELDGELAGKRGELEDAEGNAQLLETIHRAVLGVKAVLPKTDETINLLSRFTITDEDLALLQGGGPDNSGSVQVSTDDRDHGEDFSEAGREAGQQLRERPLAWVLGTSLGFTAVMFGFGAWRFSSRDF